MGLLLSVFISYVGFHEALECMKHIISGIVPDTDPDFSDLVEYYTRLLQKTANTPPPRDWTNECGQGYLCLTEDKQGILKSAAVKFYERQPNSTAILFSTKISSFGQDSFDENSQANGDYRIERIPTKTKTIITDTSESFSVGQKNKSPTNSEHVPDENERINKEKLTWEYKPKTPPPSPLPEILFQPYSGDKNGEVAYSEEFLRSRSREKSRERRNESPIPEANFDNTVDGERPSEAKIKEVPKLSSLERDESKEMPEVKEEEEEIDFWGNLED